MKVMFSSFRFPEFKEIKEMSSPPRLGDNVNLFWNPPPEVVNVVWFPTKDIDVLIDLK